MWCCFRLAAVPHFHAKRKPALKHTIEQGVNDELAVPLDQVVDVAKDSTKNRAKM